MTATTDDTCHGIPWPEVIALRNKLSYTAWRRHKCRVPLEEYFSSGNQCIVEAAQRWQAGGSLPFEAYLTDQLALRLRGVPRSQAPHGNTIATRTRRLGYRYHVELVPNDWPGWDIYLHPVYATGEARTLADEVLTDLGQATQSRYVVGYVLAVWGWTKHEIAAEVGQTAKSVEYGLKRVRQVMPACRAAWAQITPVEEA